MTWAYILWILLARLPWDAYLSDRRPCWGLCSSVIRSLPVQKSNAILCLTDGSTQKKIKNWEKKLTGLFCNGVKGIAPPPSNIASWSFSLQFSLILGMKNTNTSFCNLLCGDGAAAFCRGPSWCEPLLKQQVPHMATVIPPTVVKVGLAVWALAAPRLTVVEPDVRWPAGSLPRSHGENCLSWSTTWVKTMWGSDRWTSSEAIAKELLYTLLLIQLHKRAQTANEAKGSLWLVNND